MNKNIVIFGGGVHSLCIIDVIEAAGNFNIVGVIDSIANLDAKVAGHNVIGRQKDLKELIKKYSIGGGIIAIGDNYSRMQLQKEILVQVSDFTFVNVIHPSVIISKSATIGVGNVFMAGVIINVGTVINNHTIINTGSQLEHFSVMDDYSSLSAGVITGGYVTLQSFSAIALGATIFDRVTIGKNAVVGSGSLVTKDVAENALVYGVPARFVKERELNERFLK